MYCDTTSYIFIYKRRRNSLCVIYRYNGFGADKLPEIARGLGKGMRTLKDATNDIKHEITKTAEKNGIDTSITDDVKKELNKVKDDVEDFTGSIKRKF